MKVNVRVGGVRDRGGLSLGNLGETLEVNLQEELTRRLMGLGELKNLSDPDGSGREEEINSGRMDELVRLSVRAAISRLKTN